MSREGREALIAEVGNEVRRYQNAQDAFDDAAVARLGINRTDGRCLDILDQHGRMTAGELARESGLSSGAVTTLLDRLEHRGYVRRVRDSEDRRRVFVEPTDQARQRTWEIWGPMAAAAAGFLERHSDAELRSIRDFLRAGREFLTEHTERVRGLPPADDAGAP
jgi:DNA-binding MarR family transcriptional regulator